ncbi:MAG: ribonuclease HII [Acidimicrobiia bacterium]|nr:MAG: ribonuclease HII [Acidimicrobiia bacterium]
MAPRLRPALRANPPGLVYERRHWAAGRRWVAGVDEVGRGAWAGPLTVGVVVLPQDRRIYKVRDSKLLNDAEREALFERIVDWCVAWSVGHASPEECDLLGMSQAQRLAAARALEGLSVRPEVVLLDGLWDFVGGAERIRGGDRVSLSVAAASVVAKVTRDRIMRGAAQEFPAYNFEHNKGYPCPIHKAALQGWGPSTIHRRSWAFMDGLIWRGVARRGPAGQLTLGGGHP